MSLLIKCKCGDIMISLPSKDGDISGSLSSLFYMLDEEYKDYVNIISSSEYWGDPFTLINYTRNGTKTYDDNCATGDEPNSSYTIYLKKQKLFITDFSLKSRTNLSYNYPKSVTFEASNDDSNWDELYSFHNKEYLVGLSKAKTFHLKKRGVFRSFRIRQTDNTSSNSNHFVLHKIELFGKMCSLNEDCSYPYHLLNKSCRQHYKGNNLFTASILLFLS